MSNNFFSSKIVLFVR